MKHIKPIEYRTKQSPPTEPGWYYIKRKSKKGRKYSIIPRKVTDIHHRYGHSIEIGGVYYGPEEFDWFGPVTEVREG